MISNLLLLKFKIINKRIVVQMRILNNYYLLHTSFLFEVIMKHDI